jgi:lysozyme
MYDDALFLVSPEAFVAFNANTDPSGYRKGRGTGAGKGMASLNPGVWPVYRFDLHNGQYLALCQRAGTVTVTRDGRPPYPDTGMFGINIHRGGETGTSSEGCQTIPPKQWDLFLRSIRGAIGRGVIPYLLITVQEFNSIVSQKKA